MSWTQATFFLIASVMATGSLTLAQQALTPWSAKV
jgi:hypothetical protein